MSDARKTPPVIRETIEDILLKTGKHNPEECSEIAEAILQDIPSVAQSGKEDAVAFGEWLKESNWGEKQTWGRHDPPSYPTMDELYNIYKQSK